MIINNNIFINWLKSNIPNKTLFISIEYLDNDLIESLITHFNLTSNINNIKVYILLKSSNNDFCNGRSDIMSLLTLKNLSSPNIVIKRNTSLDFTGFLIDNCSLITINYMEDGSIANINSSISPDTINNFKSKFLNIFLDSDNINCFYNSILDSYISNSLNLDHLILNYIDLIKSNDFTYISSCFYSIIRSNIKLSPSAVPQFSNFENGAYKLPKLLNEHNNSGYSFLEIGKFLLPAGKKDGAYTKYGENHSKLAEILGLVHITNSSRSRLVYVSDLGLKFLELSDTNKKFFLKYQIYNIPLIKYLFNICFNNIIDIEEFILDISTLSQSTAKRRSSNIKGLIKILTQESNEIVSDIWSNCLNKKNSLLNKNTYDYKFTKEEANTIYNMITNKFSKGVDYIFIDSIYKSIKLYEPTLLKINKIDDSNKLFKLLSFILAESGFVFNYPFIIKDSSFDLDPFNYFIKKNEIINRNEFLDYFNKIGYSNDIINRKFDEYAKYLIRLDYDIFIDKSKFNIKSSDIYAIKSILLDLIYKNDFVTLFDLSIIYKFPDINYEYNYYLLYSIIANYFSDDFKLIYKYSTITYKYKFLFLVDIKSHICDFTDLLIYILNNNYYEFDFITISDIESFLIVNNIITTSLCKSFVDHSKLYIDEFNRLKVL